EQLNYLSQVLAVFLGRPPSQGLGYSGFLDIVLQFGIGLSMAGLLLEEERVQTGAMAEAQRQAEDQLRAGDARYRALIEGALNIITVVDAQATILYASRAASRILGLEPEQLAGRNGF